MFYSILEFLQSSMVTPVSFGWFHILAIIIVIATTVLFVKKWGHADEKNFRRLALILWCILVALEVYKQIVFTFTPEEGSIVADYSWYAFPFQFCSTPLYVIPFVVFLPEGKVRDACTMFLATFSLFGGIAVMCYPGDVFIETIGINIQTMVHHGSQVTFGILCAHRLYLKGKFSLEHFLGGVVAFASLVLVAIMLNISIYHALQANGMDDTFNMFFISPYFDCTLPVLSIFSPLVPYPVFLAIYIIGFSIAAAAIFGSVRGLERLAITIHKRKSTHDTQTDMD